MGQPHPKDVKVPVHRTGREIRPVLRPGGDGGMRTQTVNDALVTPSRHDGDGVRQGSGGDQQNSAAAASLPPQPVVIRYKSTDARSLLDKKVPVELVIQKSGAWTRLPMNRSEDNYFAIIELPPGNHQYRFMIADQPKVDSSQPTIQDGNGGEPYNVVEVNSDIMATKDDDDLIESDSGWGQVETQFDETRKYPPMMPPHLRYTPLNTPPTQVRCHHDGSLTVATHALEAEHLPLPLSVTINHVYFQKREDHVVSGMTTRHLNKYTTIAYYQGIPAAEAGSAADGSEVTAMIKAMGGVAAAAA